MAPDDSRTPGSLANADTFEECREELREVVEEWIEMGLESGHPIPTDVCP